MGMVRTVGLTILAVALLAVAILLWSKNAMRFEETHQQQQEEQPADPFADFFADDVPGKISVSRYFTAEKERDRATALIGPRMIWGRDVRSAWRDAQVIGVQRGGECRAYLLGVIAWHSAILDIVGNEALAVTYDPVCDSIVVFDIANGDDDQRFFGVSGLVLDCNMVLYDEGDLSLWPQLRAECTTGRDAGQKLDLVPFVRTTWGDWVDAHPDTLVQYLVTGHIISYRYMRRWPLPQSYYADPGIPFPVEREDHRLPNKALVIGVRCGGSAKAYPVSSLVLHSVLNDTAGRQPIVLITHSEPGAVRVYERGSHSFDLRDHQLVDELGRPWLWSEDQLFEPKSRESLARIPHEGSLWFAWAAAFPQTEVYGK